MNYLLKLKEDNEEIIDHLMSVFNQEGDNLKLIKCSLKADINGEEVEEFYFGIEAKGEDKVYLQDHLNYYFYFEYDASGELDKAVQGSASIHDIEAKIAINLGVELGDKALEQYTKKYTEKFNLMIINNSLIEHKLKIPVNVALNHLSTPNPFKSSNLSEINELLQAQCKILDKLNSIKGDLLIHLPLNELRRKSDFHTLTEMLVTLSYLDRDGFILKRSRGEENSLEIIGIHGQLVSKIHFNTVEDSSTLKEAELSLYEHDGVNCLFFNLQGFSSDGFVPEPLLEIFKILSDKEAILVTEDDESSHSDSSYIKYLEAIEAEKGNVAFMSVGKVAINSYLSTELPEKYQEVVNIAKNSSKFNNEVHLEELNTSSLDI
jgi:hypothetical protein